MMKWSEDAVKTAEASSRDKKLTMHNCWKSDEGSFQEIKAQYQRMLKGIPTDRSANWKVAVGIDIN